MALSNLRLLAGGKKKPWAAPMNSWMKAICEWIQASVQFLLLFFLLFSCLSCRFNTEP